MSESVRYIVTKAFGVIELHRSPDGLWRDPNGTIFALRREGAGLDPVDQCGIAPFALPASATPEYILAACRIHDYMYESDVYQLYHTRAEADERLRRLMLAGAGRSLWRLAAAPFKWLARAFGFGAWENKDTDN